MDEITTCKVSELINSTNLNDSKTINLAITKCLTYMMWHCCNGYYKSGFIFTAIIILFINSGITNKGRSWALP